MDKQDSTPAKNLDATKLGLLGASQLIGHLQAEGVAIPEELQDIANAVNDALAYLEHIEKVLMTISDSLEDTKNNLDGAIPGIPE